MTPEEKTLYHQIHPLKLGTDISAEVVSLYLFWKHKWLAGLFVGVLPSVLASTLIMRFANLEPYKQSALGKYVRTYMSGPVIAIRIGGTVVTHAGAWYHRPTLLPVGWAMVLVGWLRGVWLPNKQQHQIDEKRDML